MARMGTGNMGRKNFLSWHGQKPQLIVTEPDLIKEILNNRDGVYVKMKVVGYGKKLLGDGLVTTEGRKWVKQRKLANHVFHAESLKGMVPAMITAVEMMLERWKHHDQGKEIQVFQEFRLLTSDVISRTAFGTTNHEADESKRISIEDMIDECKTFYFAGHETTTSLLTWTCLLLAIHTDWQDKATREVIELLGQKNPTPDDINFISRLKTMNMIINESLRLYPPVLSIVRTVSREVRLGKLNLQANIELIISTIAIHHDPEIWGEDVHIFKPERFSEGVAKATNNNTVAFLPFGLGPRTCVGLNFAMTEAKIALAMILQRYHFTLSPTYVHSPTKRLTSCPQHGLQIMLHAL
ncbi:Cytochrome P450 [Macleaya cordata]|uniref:Cytochrome P450 n=1 Tax=Macleaya cordata TaxID=56857 RepID=A0A200Q337_MACCD|nr:Cytochrome P450 [Macleaya cordata]